MRKRLLALSLSLCMVMTMTNGLFITTKAISKADSVPAEYYYVNTTNSTITAETVVEVNGVIYVKPGDTVTAAADFKPVTELLRSKLPLDYAGMEFAYWYCSNDDNSRNIKPVEFSSLNDSTTTFVMPAGNVEITAWYKTADAMQQESTSSPWGDVSIIANSTTQNFKVSFTPSRDITITIMPADYSWKYTSKDQPYTLLNRTLEEFKDARDTSNDLYSTINIDAIKNIFLNGSNILVDPRATAPEVFPAIEPFYLSADTWDLYWDVANIYPSGNPQYTDEGLQALKTMDFFNKSIFAGHDVCAALVYATKFGDPSAAARCVDVLEHVLNYAQDDYCQSLSYLRSSSAVDEKLIEQIIRDMGNMAMLQVVCTKSDGSEQVVQTISPFDMIKSKSDYSEILTRFFYASLSSCGCSFTLEKGKTYNYSGNISGLSAEQLDTIKVCAVSMENEKKLVTGEKIITLFQKTASARTVSGFNEGSTYLNTHKSIDIAAQIADCYMEDAPLSGSRRLVPRAWRIDNGIKSAFPQDLTAALDLSYLSLGEHILTITYEGETFDGNMWNSNGSSFDDPKKFYIAAGFLSAISPDMVKDLPHTHQLQAASLGLPNTVKINTTDGVKDASVYWDMTTCTYNVNSCQAQEAAVTGVVTLPENTVNPDKNSQRVTLKLSFLKAPDSSFGKWTSDGAETHTRICACNCSETEKHVWDEGKITTEPTESSEGVRAYTCSACGAARTESIPKIIKEDVKTGDNSSMFLWLGLAALSACIIFKKRKVHLISHLR